MAAVSLNASFPPPSGTPQAGGYWHIVQRISEAALRMLSVVGMVLLLSYVLPASAGLVLLPIAATVGIVSILFYEMTGVREPEQPALPLIAVPPIAAPPAAVVAPSGIRNATAADCWLNSITQIIRIDKNMREWFERVPSHGLPVHIEWFPTFSQELLENLPAELPFEVLAGLEEDRRDAANAYAQSIRVMGDEAKQNLFTYLRFLREKEKPEKVAAALCHFKFFLHCYASGATEAGRQVMRPARRGEQAPQPYTNERLRAVLGELSPVMLSAAAIQQDAADGVRVIQDLLLPRHLQLQVESWTYYNTRGKPPLVGERVVDGCATIEQARSLSPVLLPPKGDALNIQNLIHRFIKDRNPEGRIVSNGYEYQKSKIENKFTSAPDSLWLFVNRQHMFRSPWVGLHRLMPDWFDARPPIQTKYEFSIEAQETIEVPTNGGLSRYTLDGFIWHQGADGAGHYISYVRKKDADGKDVWFELNDSVVTRLTDERMREFCSKSLIYHYSKID